MKNKIIPIEELVDYVDNEHNLIDKETAYRIFEYVSLPENSNFYEMRNIVHDLLFEEDGYVYFYVRKYLKDYIVEHNLSWNNCLVQLYYSIAIPSFTKGNYTSIYMWR